MNEQQLVDAVAAKLAAPRSTYEECLRIQNSMALPESEQRRLRAADWAKVYSQQPAPPTAEQRLAREQLERTGFTGPRCDEKLALIIKDQERD
jgi:hypothetical protein